MDTPTGLLMDLEQIEIVMSRYMSTTYAQHLSLRSCELAIKMKCVELRYSVS